MYGPLILGIVLMSIVVVGIIVCVILEMTIDSDNLGATVISGIVAACMFAGTIVLCTTPLNLVSAQNQYYEFIETKEMVEYMIDPEQGLANINLTSTVDNMNSWLTNARWSQIRWGNWSRYYQLDLDSLEYITMRVGD